MSSDEIDIEEHDVLDDPRLRHLLPDLARVKTETPDYDEGAATLGNPYAPFARDEQLASMSRFAVSSQGHQDDDHSAEYTRHNNKIILGSKPDNKHVGKTVFDSNVTVKQETPENCDETSQDSVYILGGEPNNEPEIDNHVKESHSSLLNDNHMVDIQNLDSFDLDEKKALEEQIPENAHVALEDWGPKLLSSCCYCRQCKILFSTRNALDAHKMACHSFLVAVDSNKAYKSTSKNVDSMKSCAQCNKKFANDSLLLAHVYGHLASQLNKNSSPQRSPSQIQNKFANKISFGSKPSSDVSMPGESDESSDDGVSGFYQCSVCSYYAASKSKFLTHTNRNHFISNPDMRRVDYDNNCSYCTYRNNDVSMYNAHIMSRHTNLYTKKVEKKNFHLQPKIAEDISKYQCMICNMILPSYAAARAHRRMKHPEVKGMSIIRKIVSKTQPKVTKLAEPKVTKLAAPLSPVKRKLPVDIYANTSSNNPKKPRLDKLSNKKFMMHYCSACKNAYLGHRHLTLHMDGKCCPKLVKKRVICKTCGLAVSSSKHKEFHEANPAATIHDIKFIRVQDNETIDAPIPPYFSCNICKVCAFRAHDLQDHDCDIAYNFCRYCNKSFLDLAYDIHVEFHKYDRNVSDETAKSSELPEILKQYEMLTETWNILYLCSVCNIVTDSYDKAVEHSQNHFNSMESYGVTIKKCHVCKLMFDDSCLERHLEIHNQNSNSVTKDSFKILTYDYTKLLTKKWFELFGSLPNSQIQKIVSRSVYAHCRSVKMSVFLEGAPELTLYQCHECKMYVYPPSVGTHNDLVCMRSEKKFYCDICFIPFCTARGKDAHLVTHQNRGTYRHVVFNATDDKDFDLALKTDNDETPQKIVTGLEKTHKEIKGKSTNVSHGKAERKFVTYCCIKCKINIAKKMYTKKHECGKPNKKVNTYLCKICGLLISKRTKIYHDQRHKQNKTFTRDSVKVIKFEVKRNSEGKKSIVFYKNTKDTNETLVKLIKCRCGLHFISSKAYDNHKSICTPKLKTTKCTCSKCGYLFDTNELFRHNCKHHSSEKPIKFVVVQSEDEDSNENYDDDNALNNDENPEECREEMEEQKHKLYKCGSCKLFFHFKDDIVRHLPTCDPNDKKENKCSRCDIPFYLNTIKHALTVPNCEELTENDYDISTLYPREIATTSEKINKDRCLWRCWKCDLHWATDESLKRYHYKTANHRTTHPIVKCKQCGLNFTSKAIKLHILKHHVNLKLKRQDLHIVTIPEDQEKMAEWRSEEYKKPLPKPKKPSLLWNMLTQKVSPNAPKFSNVTNRLHKCQTCQLHFLSRHTMYMHKTSGVCGRAKGVKCDICGLSFTALTLPNHMKVQHDNMQLHRQNLVVSQGNVTHDAKKKMMPQTDGKSKKRGSVDLFSCYKCRLIFLSKTSLARHIKINSHDEPRITCTACGLTINSQTFFRHKDLHHGTMKLSRKDFRLKTIIPKHIRNTIQYENDEISIKDDDENVPAETEQDGNSNIDDNRRQLYKCQNCPLHFMLRKSRRSHMVQSCGKQKEHHSSLTERCTVCKLLFTKKSLKAHMHLHHKVMKMRREDMIIVGVGKTESEPKAKTTPIQSSVPFTISKQAKAQIDVSHYDNRLWKCNDCGKHYLNATTRNTHRIHPTNPNRSCKKTPIVNCSICGLAFTNVSLAKHEYIHHEQMNLELKDFVVIDDDNQYQVAATWQQHTEESNRKYALSEKSKSILDITQYNNQIYNCKRCGLHFMKISSKQMHDSKCQQDPTDVEDCSICGLKFLASTLPKHEYIHHERLNLQLENFEILYNDESSTKRRTNPTSSTSKVYTLSEKTKAGIDIKLYNNQLFKCARCGRHLLTKASRRGHETRCLNNLMNPADIQDCPTCGLTFSGVTMLWHEYIHHDNMKLQLEDFEIVEDEKIPDAPEAEVDDSEKPDKSKTATYTMSQKIKQQIDISRYSSSIYQCKCGLNFLTYSSRRSHEPKCYEEEGTVDPEHSQKTGCSICGLVFGPVTLAKHKFIHHENLNLDRDDLNVITATGYVHRKSDEPMKEKPKKEPKKPDIQVEDMSKYNNHLYKCTRCEKHFLTSTGIRNHAFYCDTSTRSTANCPECGLAFNSTTLLKHIVIHHDNLKLQLQDFEIIENSTETVVKSTETVEKSIENDEKVSERPSRSSRSRMTRSFYAEDSEGSLNTSRASSVQNLTVDSSMFESNDNEEPVRAATPISTRLAAEYKDNKKVRGVTVDALKALDISIYNNELFKCSECNIVMMLKNSMLKHIVEKNAHVPACMQLNCDSCDEKFSSAQLVRHIYVHHEKMNLKKEDLKIVTGDELRRTLYRCVKCETNYFEEKSLITHPCGRLHPKCIICDLKFGHLGTLNIHYEKHHKKMKLSVDDMIIINIDLSVHAGKSSTNDSEELLDNMKQEIETTTEEMEVSQDEDQISQTSEDILQDLSPRLVEIASENSAAQIQETSDGILKKLTHTGEISEIDSQINDEPPSLELSTLDISLYDNKLFKCVQCSLHFLATENFRWHLDNSDHKSVRKIHCTICGLAFSAKALPTHTFIHHEKLKLGAGDFKVIYGMVPEAGPSNLEPKDSVVTQSSDESMTENEQSPKKSVPEPVNITSSDEVVPTKKYTTKLYKCSECNVHFLSQASCYKHTNKHEPFDPFDYIACKICGLQFGNMTFPKHVIQHHKNKEFHPDQVLIEAYEPTKEHGTPKIEIYLAIDKLQSKLVSTTTEKDVPVSSSFDEKSSQDVPESTSSVADPNPELSSVTETKDVKSDKIPTLSTTTDKNVPVCSTEEEKSTQDIPNSANSSQESRVTKKTESTSLIAEPESESITVTEDVKVDENSSQDVPKTTSLVAESLVTEEEKRSKDIPESASSVAESEAELVTENKKISQDIPESTSSVAELEPEPISETDDMEIDEICTLKSTIQKDIPDTSLVAEGITISESLTENEKLSHDTSESTSSVVEPPESKMTEAEKSSHDIPEPTEPDPSLGMVGDKSTQDIPSSVVEPETELMTEVVKSSEDIPESTNSVSEADPVSSLVTEDENTSQDIPGSTRKSSQDIPESTRKSSQDIPESTRKSSQDIPESTSSVAEPDPESSLVTEDENTSQDIPDSTRKSSQDIPESTNSFVEPDLESRVKEDEKNCQNIPEDITSSQDIPEFTSSGAEPDPSSMIEDVNNSEIVLKSTSSALEPESGVIEDVIDRRQDIPEPTSSIAIADAELPESSLMTEDVKGSQDIPEPTSSIAIADAELPESSLMTEDVKGSQDIPEPTSLIAIADAELPESSLMTEDVKGSQDIPEPTSSIAIADAELPESSLMTEDEKGSQDIPEPTSSIAIADAELPESSLMTEDVKGSQDIPEPTSSIAIADAELLESSLMTEDEKGSQDIPEPTSSIAIADAELPESSLMTEDVKGSQDIPEPTSLIAIADAELPESSLMTEDVKGSQDIPEPTSSIAIADAELPESSLMTEDVKGSQDIPEPTSLIAIADAELPESSLMTEDEKGSQDIPEPTSSIAIADAELPESSLMTEDVKSDEKATHSIAINIETI